MTLDAKSFGLSGGLVYAIMMLMMTLMAVFCGMGMDYMGLMTGLLPGFSISIIGSIIGAVYGFIMGFVFFFFIAHFYNMFSS
jgi:hypothetical protein